MFRRIVVKTRMSFRPNIFSRVTLSDILPVKSVYKKYKSNKAFDIIFLFYSDNCEQNSTLMVPSYFSLAVCNSGDLK